MAKSIKSLLKTRGINVKESYKQQGDVIIFKTDMIPSNAKFIETKIIQHGEATGHAHRLDTGEIYEAPDKTKYLRLVTEARISHEEHNTIDLAPGDYRIGIVREYDHFSEEARQVVD